ncbi:aspartyl-phosphate phosphatase Spo0E family protein [Halonatronum saccharophilum]|uniref:aspartyl-phosphate phosphatase Spo0E family protein n=1 Tax=Halonatronum saccharophilum TaxID=150060 RepID=UPI000489FC0D|nr:aspartyl-phosphate phosphatase Spo0E family protein [Halonatronum saccharophilum]
MESQIKRKINRLKKRMVSMAYENKNNLLDDNLQKVSKELDKAILEYMSSADDVEDEDFPINL